MKSIYQEERQRTKQLRKQIKDLILKELPHRNESILVHQFPLH